MSAPEPERSARRRVLIVEDHIDAAEVSARLLEVRGYEVRQAHDGLQALECVVQMRPQIILLDLHLPKLDGLTVARQIRALDLPAQPIIVAVTALGSAQDRLATEQAGIDVHLVKPIEWDVLERVFEVE